ncbi:MAG TPA: terminase large subunit [Firmicutes bacterium]|nr:terminase large subunit [Bacillota bacterium]
MFDEARAEHAVRFINLLKHAKGKWAGHPFNLRPWQEKIVRDIFGTVNRDGTRQYRTAYVEIPRKNGKTALAAALALYLLVADGEYGAEIYSAACDREQASLAFDVAAAMVRQLPALKKILKVIDSQKRIVYPKTNSFYRAIAADAASSHGYNAHAVIADELHAWPNRELWDVLTTSTGARSQPLVFAITTAGYDRNSICYEQHDYARKLLDGVIKDDTYYPVIYSADESDDWEDEATWKKANPALGDFRNLDEMRQLYHRAKEVPSLQNTFRRLYLNQWTSQETRWLDMATWDASAGLVVPERLKGRDCYGGIDLSTTTDLTAVVLAFPLEDKVYVLPHFFIPADTAREAEKRDRVPYTTWARQGFITLTPGNVVDYSFVEERIRRLGKEYHVLEWAYDRWNADALVQRLQADGAKMVPVGMGYASLSAPTKYLETLLLQEKLVHGGHPVLRWNADNVMTEQDAAGNIKPSKAKSTQRIDGIMALVLALSRLMLQEKGCVYNERDLMVI